MASLKGHDKSPGLDGVGDIVIWKLAEAVQKYMDNHVDFKASLEQGWTAGLVKKLLKDFDLIEAFGTPTPTKIEA